MIFYNRIQIAKWTGIFEGINILAGLFLFHLFTRMYGLFIGILIGWPFGRFLAAHPSFYQFVQDVVRGGYVFTFYLSCVFFTRQIGYTPKHMEGFVWGYLARRKRLNPVSVHSRDTACTYLLEGKKFFVMVNSAVFNKFPY